MIIMMIIKIIIIIKDIWELHTLCFMKKKKRLLIGSINGFMQTRMLIIFFLLRSVQYLILF